MQIKMQNEKHSKVKMNKKINKKIIKKYFHRKKKSL